MDVDIDLPSTFRPEALFPWTRAAVVKDGVMTPHPCGYYPQRIGKDDLTGLAAIPYDVAEQVGYFKVDFLHLSVYDKVTSRPELETFLDTEPNWNLLLSPSVQPKLFQLAKHGDLLDKVRPRDIETLADCMALIRPGKKALLGLYLKAPLECRKALYAQDDTGYTFKKSHSLAYSLVIVVQLHLIEQGRL